MDDPKRRKPAAGISIRITHLFVLSAFTTAQPLYDLLTRYPEFLPAHQTERVDIVLLTLGLSLLLPGAVALVVWGLHSVYPRLAIRIYLALLGLLTAGLALQALKKLPLPAEAALVLALLSGAGLILVYFRYSVTRTFLSYLLPAVVLFPLLFLLDSGIRKLIFPDSVPDIETQSGASAPVVMVVFDEFPLISLLNREREIDSQLFPNLASLAENSYWFRNATSNNEGTLLSIPVILTGTVPQRVPFPLPVFQEYPRSLFSLLHGSHDLQIQENVTQLNPWPTPTPFVPRFRLLVEDLSIAYLHLLLPASWASRWLPPVTQTWKDFMNRGSPGAGRRSWEDFRVDWSQRADRFRLFVDSIRNSARPTLYFLHSMLPHASWKYLPSGKLYTLSERPGVAGVVGPNNQGLDVNLWLEDPWLVDQSYQRHLLQVMFVDRLVGELIEQLHQENLYDSALLVLTADHGASFRPGDSRRRVTDTNYMDIMSIPLIIKAPGQRRGVVSDRNVESVDILPTMIEMLGIETDWSLDGQSALAAAAPERREKIIYSDRGEKFSLDSRLEARWRSLDRKLELFGAVEENLSEEDLYRIGPHADLVGKRVDPLVGENSDLKVEIDGSHFFGRMDRDSPFLLSRISGRIVGSRSSALGRSLAIGVNGTVRAVTQTTGLGGEIVFSGLVPEQSFRDGSNEVRVFETRRSGSGLFLLPVELPDPASYQLGLAGDRTLLVTPEGREIPVGDPGVIGWVVSRQSEDKSRMFIGGWGADVENFVLPRAIVLFRDGEFFYAGRTGRHRNDVQKRYGSTEIDNSGYFFEFLIDDFAEFKDTEVRVFIVTPDGRASESNYPRARGYGELAFSNLTETLNPSTSWRGFRAGEAARPDFLTWSGSKKEQGLALRQILAPQYLQCTASLSCPSSPHAGQAWVDTSRSGICAISADTMPVGTAIKA